MRRLLYVVFDDSNPFNTHPWWWRQYAPLKRRSTIILQGSICQKTTLNIVNSDYEWLQAEIFGFNSQYVQNFFYAPSLSDRLLNLFSPLSTGIGVKWPERVADHSLLSSVEVMYDSKLQLLPHLYSVVFICKENFPHENDCILECCYF
jgi:hypothetical protein